MVHPGQWIIASSSFVRSAATISSLAEKCELFQHLLARSCPGRGAEKLVQSTFIVALSSSQ